MLSLSGFGPSPLFYRGFLSLLGSESTTAAPALQRVCCCSPQSSHPALLLALQQRFGNSPGAPIAVQVNDHGVSISESLLEPALVLALRLGPSAAWHRVPVGTAR